MRKENEAGGKLEEFEKLKKEILSCRLCEEKFGFEPHPVFRGNMNSKIMHISQAPSKTVHETLKSFNDASGRKLRGEWYHISDEVFYNPDNFYITSIAHCYPGKSPHKGDNPPPKSCAAKWLAREIELVNYDIMILVGGKAAEYFFPRQSFTSLVFQEHEINNKPAYVIPHPSPLNVKWFMDNPEFEKTQIIKVREAIHRVLEL